MSQNIYKAHSDVPEHLQTPYIFAIWVDIGEWVDIKI